MLRAQAVERPLPTVEAALHHLGYVQIDPLNICGRMHDLILRNRVVDYREGDLMRHVHGENEPAPAGDCRSPPQRSDSSDSKRGRMPGATTDSAARETRKPAEARTAFEHHLPDTHLLVAFPLEAWPHLRAAMRERSRHTSAWSGRLTPTERQLAPRLLAEIAQRGPMSSDEFDDRRRAHRVVWGKSSLVKSTLQKLFFHGELLIAERDKHRRRYDLPQRVIPAHIAAQREADPADTARWLVVLKLRQRRLATLKRAELPLVQDLVRPVSVPGCPPLYCLNKDVPVLDSAASAERDDAAVRLLAPLDPLIYDRRLTKQLWQFDYTWEAYTPAAKRVRGHYALPVLAGTELVGHVERKADRVAGKLIVASRSVRRGYSTTAPLDELAAWLGLRRGANRAVRDGPRATA